MRRPKQEPPDSGRYRPYAKMMQSKRIIGASGTQESGPLRALFTGVSVGIGNSKPRTVVTTTLHKSYLSMKNANKIWTREDEELLVKLASEGHSDRNLAKKFSRTVHAVQIRLQILGAKSRPQKNSGVQRAEHALIPATAPVGAVVDHLYSVVLKRRGLRRHYKLKTKTRSAIMLLLRDLLRCVEHSQGVNITAWRHLDIEYVLFNELLQYLEEQCLVDRVVSVSPIELARHGKSKSVTGTRKLRELCIRFGLRPDEEASFYGEVL
jgi:hypothetical protein